MEEIMKTDLRKNERIKQSRVKRNKTKIAKNAALYVVLALMSVYFIFPYFFMIFRSVMPSWEICMIPVRFFPSEITFEGYAKMFGQHNYVRYIWNTLKMIAFNIVAVPLSSSLCAYGFAKINFPFRKQIFAAVIATIMIPGAVTQVPLYVMFAKLGWTESVLPLTIPSLFGGGAMNIFLLIQFMKNVSNEIENAAKIDGANLFQRYMLIVIPLCKPIIIYIMVGVFSSGWSDFYGPLVYLKTRNNYTLALAIYYDSLTTNVSLETANVRMAAGVFMSIPTVLIFLVYQKNLIEGIQIGAVKG